MGKPVSADITNLLPQFELLLQGEYFTPPGLAAAVVAIILVLFSGALAALIPGTLRSLWSIRFIERLLKSVDTDTLPQKRRDLLARARRRRRLGHLWAEFDETLVESPDGQRLYNTYGAEHFFNTHNLAMGVTESRLLAAIPGILTAVGVIGTFIGLQLGLSGLDIGDTEKAHTAINQLIGGASIAFMTSVWGVGTSVVFNIVEKLIEQSLRKHIANLQARIDNLFPRISPEQTLLYMRDDGKRSSDVLEGLAERIGTEMQKRMVDATDKMQAGIESGLERVLAPALTQLVQASNDLSNRQASGAEEALRTLIETHIQSLTSSGEPQR